MIPIIWTSYTATLRGRFLKLVPCESCATEYVYVLEREALGCGTSFYLLNEEGAEQQAREGAEDTLRSSLENDFDPVPCPVCGHYQRHMFPKLYDGGSALAQTARVAAIAGGCLAFVAALYWSVAYLWRPDEYALVRLAAAWVLLAVLGLIVFALGAAERSRARRFDPNTEGQQARVAKGRSRAVTRAEFEAGRRPELGPG
jgi:hypothetical protein